MNRFYGLFLQLLLSSFLLVLAQRPTLAPPSTFGDGSTQSTITAPSTASGSASSQIYSSSAPASSAFPDLSSFSTCVTNCTMLAVAASNCSTPTDVNCYCTRQTFPSFLTSCIEGDCPAELPQAQSLAGRFCALALPSTSPSFTISSFSLTSSTSPPSTGGGSDAPSSSSSAPGPSNIARTAWAETLTAERAWTFVLTGVGAIVGAWTILF